MGPLRGGTGSHEPPSRGPAGYEVRKRVPVDGGWLECTAEMSGTSKRGYRDASDWTAQERDDVLDVCRSFRVLRIEQRPRSSADGPERRPVTRLL